jgi:chemotaxis protein CheX
MNLQHQIADSIRRSVIHVFSTMLGVELGPGEASIERSTPDANDGVVSFIGVAGAWAGTGSVFCSADLACRVCNQMVVTDNHEVNEEVLDAIAELTNMIVGSVKTDLEGQVGPLGLSIPTVVFGRNFRTKSAGATDWVVVRFPWEGEMLQVKMGLAPHEKAARLFAHPAGHVCSVDV